MDFTDPNRFVVREYVYMFESHWMEYECYVGTDGIPVSYEEVHSIDRTHYVNDYDYISLVDITAGTEFTFIRTDCKTYEDAKTGDGRYCRLYIDWSSEEEVLLLSSYRKWNGCGSLLWTVAYSLKKLKASGDLPEAFTISTFMCENEKRY